MISKDINILIVGLGLIGGSYAESLTNQGYKVSAIARRPETINYALENKLISYGTTEIDPKLIGESGLIIFGLYPGVFIDWIEKYGHFIQPGTIITDVTGVKGYIVDKIQGMLPEGVEFIAAHPMAGKEVYGVENADENIFKNANYIVTPSPKNTEKAIYFCKDLGKTLGFAQISVLSPEEHDEMIAFLSQLTHCIAVALMNANSNKHINKYTGDSFRDLTRIARINENMWSELFIDNKKALVKQIDNFQTELNHLREYIENENVEEMKEMMIISTNRRALFDKKN